MLPIAALMLASFSSSGFAAPAAAAGAADPQLLEQFVRIQDLAYEAAEEARCAAEGEQAVAALHERYDRRLVVLANWLQQKFSDEDLKEAQARVHGTGDTFVRTKPACPVEPEQIQASEAAYADALAKLEIEVQSRMSSEGR
jgi:hypothetical protein